MDVPPPLPPLARLSAKSKRRLVTASIVSLLAVIAAVVFHAEPWLSEEETMLKGFRIHQADFERIAQMAAEDTHLFRVTSQAIEMDSEKDPTLSVTRAAEYRRLLGSVGANDGLKIYDDVIWIDHSTFGLSVSYTTKGWAFTKQPIRPNDGNRWYLLASSDRWPKQTVDGTYFRPIRGGWYLYLDSD